MKNLLNKLALGTAQFGLAYGINNQTGKPSREKSLAMLDFAYKKDLRVFDTARAYGDAEEILGEFSESRGLGGAIKIITKLKSNIISEIKGKISDIIFGNLEESLSRLKRDYVDGYLLHTPEYIREDKIVSALVDLKRQGLIKNLGVSIYEEADAIYAAKLKEVDYIQVPYNIFDQRMDKSGFFQLAKKKGKTVFVRSVFLQGLFLMSEDKIPASLEKVKEYLKSLDEIIGRYGLTRAQTALLFSLENKDIDYVVFGVDNLEQLKEIINLAERPIDGEKCFEELKNKFINIEKDIIFPSLWKK
ncbi:MAG: aldo/keto reductase [bacterium]|nr:aldo/keto reductase [bacterium]